jgi:hypothetical protein
MGCPYLATTGRSSCNASPAAYFQSIYELKEYCNAAHQEQCPFFIHAASSTLFEPPDHHLWSLGSFRRSRPIGCEQKERTGRKALPSPADGNPAEAVAGSG